MALEKTFYTPEGSEKRALTNEELEQAAADGATDAKLEILKRDVGLAAGDTSKRLDAIEKYLGI